VLPCARALQLAIRPMAPKKKGKGRGRGIGLPRTVKVPKKADKNKEGESFEFVGPTPDDDLVGGKLPKRSPGSTSSEETADQAKLPRAMPSDEVPNVSPIDLYRNKKKKKVFRANFSLYINKMRKTLEDSKNLRIKTKGVKILSSVANDLIERFTDDAAKLTRDRSTDMVLVRSAEAAVKLNIPESLESMCVVMARRAVLRYANHHATMAEKEAVFDKMEAAHKKGSKDPKKDEPLGKRKNKKTKEIANMNTDEFCKEIRMVSKTLRDKMQKAQQKDKDKTNASPAASSGLA